jgi:hypothetical protein
MSQRALEVLSHSLLTFNDAVTSISAYFKDNGEFKFTELSQIPETIRALINMKVAAMGFRGKQAIVIRDYVMLDLLNVDDPVPAQNLFKSENVEL